MISVIVPIYNVEPYLRKCVDSILNQTYRDLEVLLIDDGSPDDCASICDQYAEQDKRIRVFHTSNHGLSAARNLGLKEAKGDYIGFVDSDDWIESDMYSTLLKRLDKKNADICVCGYTEDLLSSSVERSLDKATYTGREVLDALLREKIDNYVWNKLFKRDLFQGIWFPDGKNFEDVVVMNKIFYHASCVAVTPTPEYHYCAHQESITKTYSAKNLIDFADSHLGRYRYFRHRLCAPVDDNQALLLCYAARGISKVWRWWYACDREEKRQYIARIKEFEKFAKAKLPLFGLPTWPLHLRLTTFFMHSSNFASFAVIYWLNQLFLMAKP